ncbi:mechanosensitive ion channel [Arsenicitalea aurantiaca]|uniref:Small-conductance mechanosensitive channel n=1 Tax=Arsenicitalea aurantiaca TaxID=1783274 RepID=A0A433XGM6_9HYPH|nr:mechanosensitive ion channel domain-containing protein [Arsenicitalea aurantiaca]RUT33164.1 mechanosensitive ion channel [Arsenicitalea aurantiaca]
MTETAAVDDAVRWVSLYGVPLLSALGVLLAGMVVSRIAGQAIRSMLPLARGVDKNFAPLLSQIAQYGIMIFAIVTALNFIGVPSTSILAVLGAAGLAIALALQGTLANIAAGIMLIWLRPIAIGEYVTGDGVAGVVVEIGLFGTRLRSTTGLYIFTPNQKLWSSVITNHSREPNRRVDVNITVPETCNIAGVRRTLLRIANADKRVMTEPMATAHVDSFAGDKVVVQLRAWVPTSDYIAALHTLTEEAKLAVNRELAAQHEGRAEVAPATDPHVQGTGQPTA